MLYCIWWNTLFQHPCKLQFLLASQLFRWLSQQVLQECPLYACVCVSATYPNGQKRYIIPAKKCLKRIISANTFWLSLFELTHLSGILNFTLAILRLVQRPWLEIYTPLNSCVGVRFPTVVWMPIHVGAHSFSTSLSGPQLQFCNCCCSHKINDMVCATLSCRSCRR